MFTGIIRDIGISKKKVSRGKQGMLFEITSKKISTKVGMSIGVNGVCLTVTKKTAGGFLVDVIPETLQRTNLGQLKIGSKVNLEPSMKLSDAFDGHFVTGHVDATGKIVRTGENLTISAPQKLMKFIAEKGSIAVNGVSLTVAKVQKNIFTVALIPFTKNKTNLGGLKKGDSVNIEVDLIARYVIKEALKKY